MTSDALAHLGDLVREMAASRLFHPFLLWQSDYIPLNGPYIRYYTLNAGFRMGVRNEWG